MWLIVDNKFEICNDAAVNELGYANQSELQNTHPSQLSPEYQEDGKSSFLKAERILAETSEKGHKRFNWIHSRKDGENFPVEVTLTKVPSKVDNVFYCVWRDITQRKQLEQQLIDARNAAEKANRAKSRFLSMMSHELRTPINAVLGFSDMLRHNIAGPLEDNQMELVNSIYRGGELLLGLVDDLLSMSEIEQGELRLEFGDIKVLDIQNVAVSMVESLAEKFGVNLHVNGIPKHLDCVVADQLRAVQVLVNLLSNAIKYHKSGGNVWLKLKAYKKFVRFVVIDDGDGIDPNYTDHIFEPFNRGDKVASGVEGTGLGLPICHRLAEAMGGHCGFHSVHGEGSTFWLDLPVCED